MTVERGNHLGRLNHLLATEDTDLAGGREALRVTKRRTIDVRRILLCYHVHLRWASTDTS